MTRRTAVKGPVLPVVLAASLAFVVPRLGDHSMSSGASQLGVTLAACV